MCYSIIGDNMEDRFYKYACLLLDKGLNISKGQPLVITAPIEAISFVRVLSRCCLDRGVTDIYYDFFDDELNIWMKMVLRRVCFLIRKYMMSML